MDQDTPWAWCDRCMEPREIMDEFDDVIQYYDGQHSVHVTQLECDHSITREDGTFFPFP